MEKENIVFMILVYYPFTLSIMNKIIKNQAEWTFSLTTYQGQYNGKFTQKLPNQEKHSTIMWGQDYHFS